MLKVFDRRNINIRLNGFTGIAEEKIKKEWSDYAMLDPFNLINFVFSIVFSEHSKCFLEFMTIALYFLSRIEVSVEFFKMLETKFLS